MTNTCKWVPKGWGGEKWIVNNDKYCGKILYIMKDKKCSLHYHKDKDETFYIQKGTILLYYSDNVDGFMNIESFPEVEKKYKELCRREFLNRGDTFHIPPGRVHQMIALTDTELLEFSTHHEDSDSYRIIKGD